MENREETLPAEKRPLSPAAILALLGIALFEVAYHTGWIVIRVPTAGYPLLAIAAFFLARRSVRRYRETGQRVYIAWALILGPGALFFLFVFLSRLV